MDVHAKTVSYVIESDQRRALASDCKPSERFTDQHSLFTCIVSRNIHINLKKSCSSFKNIKFFSSNAILPNISQINMKVQYIALSSISFHHRHKHKSEFAHLLWHQFNQQSNPQDDDEALFKTCQRFAGRENHVARQRQEDVWLCCKSGWLQRLDDCKTEVGYCTGMKADQYM